MNFADALREAAKNSGVALPSEMPVPSRPAPVIAHGFNGGSTTVKERKAKTDRPRLEVVDSSKPAKPQVVKLESKKEVTSVDARTSEQVSVPQAPTVPGTPGSVVRLELFLTPEQLSGLFRAVVANQHSVMTLREAASYLRVSASRLEEMAQEGDIPAFLIDGKWRFPRNSVDEWLTMQPFRKEMEA